MYTVVFDPEVYPMDRAWITGKAPTHHASNAGESSGEPGAE